MSARRARGAADPLQALLEQWMAKAVTPACEATGTGQDSEPGPDVWRGVEHRRGMLQGGDRRQPSYEPSPTRCARRTKSDIDAIESAIYDTLEADHPQTLRGLFYQLVGQGVVPKTEAAYKGLVGRLAVRMRRAGVLPYHWLADNTRWMRKPSTYGSLEACLRRTAETYRRAVFDDMPTYVEVWLEKDALAGVLYDVTGLYDVPLMVTRGYPSLSFLFEAAECSMLKGSLPTSTTLEILIRAVWTFRGRSKPSFGAWLQRRRFTSSASRSPRPKFGS